MAAETFHTCPIRMARGMRPACTEWSPRLSAAEAVAATIRCDPDAVVLSVVAVGGFYRGLAPGGLGA